MQDRGGVLQLAGLADDGGFAITVRLPRRDAQRLHAALPQQIAQFFANGDQFVEGFAVSPGVWVADHGHGQRAPGGRLHGATAFGVGFIDADDQFADLGFHDKASVWRVGKQASCPQVTN